MSLLTAFRTVRRLPARHAGALAVVSILFFGGIGVGTYAPGALGLAVPAAEARGAPNATPQPADVDTQARGQGCPGGARGVAAEPFVRTELFFGTRIPDGSEVTDAEFFGFLDREITPRFPDGLTLVAADGQFRDGAVIIKERSKLLILHYPQEAARDKGAAIEEIRALYVREFRQQSVLRADDPRPVCVSF
jgi:hypothetical protein